MNNIETLKVPSYLYNWMVNQSKSQFVGDMLQQIQRNGGLNESQLIEIKVKFIQAGNNIPSK